MNFKLKDDEGIDESNQLREEKKMYVCVCEREKKWIPDLSKRDRWKREREQKKEKYKEGGSESDGMRKRV